MKETKRCSRCILPVTFPNSKFDEHDVCNFCSNHKTASMLGEAKLRETLHAEKGSIYDCVVPISGGKDSTYVLYYAVHILNLRAIAVNYDAGFQSDLARENVKNTCNILNVPLVIKNADYETNVKMLQEILRMSEIMGTFFGICGNCGVNIRTAAINTAKEYNVPFILSGESTVESAGAHSFASLKAFRMKIRIRNVVPLMFHILKYCFYSVRQRIQMKVPIRYRFRPKGPSIASDRRGSSAIPWPKKKVKVIEFFDYIEWDSINKVDFLVENLGWKYPGNHEHRFDCLLHCFGNHRWLQGSGITGDGFTYSTMIRNNLMKREDAILKEELAVDEIEKECLEMIEKVGLKEYKMPTI